MQIPSLRKPKFLNLRKPKFLKKICEYWTNIPSKLKQALSILLVLVLATALWLFLVKKTTITREGLQVIQPTPFATLITTPVPTPTPTPTPRPIPHGKIGFSVSQSDKTKPQFGRGNIDPYDPPQDSKQIVTISIKDEQPITQVAAIFETDNTVSQSFPLQLISGTETDGQWQGSWTVNDTYFYTYNLILEATSSRGQSTIKITLR